MKRSKFIFLFVVFILPLIIVCTVVPLMIYRSTHLPDWATSPSIDTGIPADFGTPTGSSPMSGDWSAQTDFGKIAFTIAPDGQTVEGTYVNMNNWTCGGVTLTTGVLSRTDPPDTVTGGNFSTSVGLDDADENYHDIYISGQYDETTKKFTGQWEERAFNTTCTGTWETASRP